MSFSRRNVVSRGAQLLLALGLSAAVLAPAQAQSGPVVVENRAGAGGQIAATVLKSSPADGHTLLLSHDHTISILPQVVKNPGFNPATDFVPVAGFATFANVLAVSGGTPAKTMDEYVKWVRTQKGGKETIGIPAPASIPEFLVKMISDKYKIDVQPAPYRGSAPMTADMLGNQITAGIASVPDFIENHKAGKVGTPQPIIDKYGDALQKVLAMPDVKQKLTTMGLTVGYEPQGQFAGRVRTYTQTWEKIIQSSGFKPL